MKSPDKIQEMLSITDIEGVSIPSQLLDELEQTVTITSEGKLPRTILEGFKAMLKMMGMEDEWQKPKGLNTSLPCPLIFFKDNLGDEARNGHRVVNEDNPVEIPILDKNVMCNRSDFEFVTFNVKNLIKHYNLPEHDARIFYRMFSKGPFKLKLAKPLKASRVETHMVSVIRDENGQFNSAVWACEDLSDGYYTKCDIPLSNKLAGDICVNWSEKIPPRIIPLPIQVWRDVTEKWLLSRGETRQSLSLSRMNKHTVNMIRHCAKGYEHSWKLAKEDEHKTYHDWSFDLVMKQIWNTYPMLQTEVTNQFKDRERRELRKAA
ncbi:hypothetical protein [Vibrio sp. D431a]|uniref:hypothetical protein n=1 Tax=Vibrio sp. D431a TaxID=2837388 RepID=UPI0025570FE4|nr:hypothetical protein [Vibrio sp. D431a]MDK9789885.1 hypothetical protein [Vibrio sp. D431a]